MTYLPMRKRFLYLVAIMDWFTLKVLAWRISNTLEADFCVEALNEAIHRFSAHEITEHRSAVTVHVFRLGRPVEADRHPKPMHGKGRCIDNIFIERF